MSIYNKIKSRLYASDPKSIQLIKNVSFSFIIKGIAALVSLFTIPAYMNYFSNQTVLGLWFTAISMLTWILTFDLGIGNGLRNNLVEPLSQNNTVEIRKNISSAYISVALVVLGLLLASIILIPQLNWNAIFNISKDVVSSEVLLFMVSLLIVGILVQFWLKLITSILYALQKSALIGLLSLSSSVMMLIFTLFAGTDDVVFNIKALSIAYVFTANIPYLLATIILFSTILRQSKPSLKYVKKEYSRRIVKLGGVFFYLQILTMIMFGTNEFLISWLVDPDKVVTFQIYNKLYSLLGTFFHLALTPVWSAVTEACVKKDYLWVKRLYSKLNRILFILIPLYAVIIIFMPLILKVWLGVNNIEVDYSLGVLFAIYNILFMKMSIDTSIIAGIGDLKIQSISLTLSTFLKFILSFILVRITNNWISVIYANIIALIPYLFIEFFDIKKKLKFNSRGEVND